MDHGVGGGIEVGIEAGGETGGHGCAEGTGLGLARELDRLLENVGVDLEPEPRLGPAATEKDPRDVQAVRRGVLENVTGAAGGCLVEGAEDVAGSVRER